MSIGACGTEHLGITDSSVVQIRKILETVQPVLFQDRVVDPSHGLLQASKIPGREHVRIDVPQCSSRLEGSL